VKILAVPVLHFCLMSFLALPLFHERQTARPYQWFSEKKRDVLTRGILKIKKDMHELRFLQVRVRGGDVLHFRGDTSFLSWYSLKVLVSSRRVCLLQRTFASMPYSRELRIDKRLSGSPYRLVWQQYVVACGSSIHLLMIPT